jgi:subtilase family serine protease
MSCTLRSWRAAVSARRWIEPMESRLLCSAATAEVQPLSHVTPATLVPGDFGYTPAQVRAAYGFDDIRFTDALGNSVVGDGTGQRIAIVVAYDAPTLADDFRTFNAAFGLPDTDGRGNFALTQKRMGKNIPYNADWALEAALDTQWAHAMAPGAEILVVHAKSARFGDMFRAVDWARKQRDVVVVSMSWGADEFNQQWRYDKYFQTPQKQTGSKQKPGVTFVAASGDDGAPGGYPAMSQRVLSVGGTSLSLAPDGSIQSETGWSGSGGGFSYFLAQPGYQATQGPNWVSRTNPDVSFNADPNTSFAVYSSVTMDDGYYGWYPLGGTSAGAPQWAALVAIAAQGRELAGTSPLDGFTQTLPALYQMSAANFHDVTQGNNGYSAGEGYDMVTGLGSPVADRIVSDFLSTPGALTYKQMRAAYRATTTLVVDRLMQKPDAKPKALWTYDQNSGGTIGLMAPMTRDWARMPVSDGVRSTERPAAILRLVRVDDSIDTIGPRDGLFVALSNESQQPGSATSATHRAPLATAANDDVNKRASRLLLVDVELELTQLQTLPAAA